MGSNPPQYHQTESLNVVLTRVYGSPGEIRTSVYAPSNQEKWDIEEVQAQIKTEKKEFVGGIATWSISDVKATY